MLLMAVCAVLLLAGVAAVVAWGGERLLEPAPPIGAPPSRRAALGHYGRWLMLLAAAVVGPGVLVAGAGGRLAMRLLAITSHGSRGRRTEGQALIGEITLEGTAAFVVFGAMPLALIAGALFLLVAPWLPQGRLGGLAYGGLLLVLGAPFLDPLRADNLDFDLLGPGWLSVLVLGGLVVLHGAAVAAIAGRVSRALRSPTWRTWLLLAVPIVAAAPLVPLAAIMAALPVVVGALVVLAAPRLLPWFLALRSSPRGTLVGRVVLGVAAAVALPALIWAVVSIVSR
ncbi:hypothetical protein [Agrococcus carbonis]|uniref:Uncharacterized protein n=1 Tax=Agrococcus carbonis TaxID=684552 RepID=A0A1H1KVK3_9MICO|nr:hypothetical protein [Agrococcus carbonis]SDR66354.1 hypothetical protein SAMN04489719_0177 [Agrococcus carbonis]